MESVKVYCKNCVWNVDLYGRTIPSAVDCLVYNEYSDTYTRHTKAIQNSNGECDLYKEKIEKEV